MRSIRLCLAIVPLILVGAACSPTPAARHLGDFFPGDATAITHIVILSGMSGETHVLTDAAEIAECLALLNSLTFTRRPDQAPRGGFLYRVTLFEGEQEVLEMTFENQSVAVNDVYYALDMAAGERLEAFYADAPEPVSFYRLRFALTTTAQGARLTAQDTQYFLTGRLMDVTGAPLKWGGSVQGVWVGQTAAGNSVGVTIDYIVTSRGRLLMPVPYVFEQLGEGTSVLRVSNVAGEGLESIAEISYSGGDPRRFSLDLSLLDARPRLVESIPARPQKMLWAYYYPWYYADNWDTSILQDRPLLGYYGSDSRPVIEQHVVQAQGVGIDGFISSWWGPDSDTDKNLQVLLDVAQARGFSVMINFELLESDGQPRSGVEVFKWLRYAISEYGDHPAYAKVDGRPVFVIWASETLSNASWEEILSRLAAEGFEPFLLGQFSGEWAGLDSLGIFDGLYQYNILNVIQSNDQVDVLDRVYEVTGRTVRYYPLLMDTPAPRLWAATIQPGYDDHLIPGRSSPILGRDDGALYRATWNAALSSAPDWIFITTWNEWLEHTYIEPSVLYGDQYLQITREFAERWK